MNPTAFLVFFPSCVLPLIIHNWSHSLSSLLHKVETFFLSAEKRVDRSLWGCEIEAAGHLYHCFNLTDNYWSQTSQLPVAPFQSHFKSAAGDLTQGLLNQGDIERQDAEQQPGSIAAGAVLLRSGTSLMALIWGILRLSVTAGAVFGPWQGPTLFFFLMLQIVFPINAYITLVVFSWLI